MNDFSELENDLKALRPARPSPVLFERIEEAMAENCRASAAPDAGPSAHWLQRFTEAPFRFGIGLAAAAAAVVLLIARINTDQTRNEETEIAQVSPSSQTKLLATPKLGGGGNGAPDGRGGRDRKRFQTRSGAGPAAGQPHEVLAVFTELRPSRGTPSGVTRISG